MFHFYIKNKERGGKEAVVMLGYQPLHCFFFPLWLIVSEDSSEIGQIHSTLTFTHIWEYCHFKCGLTGVRTLTRRCSRRDYSWLPMWRVRE